MANRASFQMPVHINEYHEALWTETNLIAKKHNRKGEATIVVGATTIIQ
jgi:hypothetical protein